MVINRLCATALLLGVVFCTSNAQYAKPAAADGLAKLTKRDLRYAYGRYEIPITNDGRFGWDPEYNVPGGGRWPRGSNEGYIFGAGIWIAAMIDSVKQVTVGYNPVNIQTEMVPGDLPNEPGYTDPTEIVYVSSDYPDASLPPWPRGYDNVGRPVTVSQMDTWSICNDLDASRQFETGKPIGVLLTTETFSWNSNFRDVWDVAFIRYTIKNINPDGKTWSGAYIGFAMDADIGDPTNDLTGCVPELNLGYCFSGPNLTTLEEGLDHPPGYVGIKFLDGPAKDPVSGAAKMSTFVKWASELTPNTDDIRYDLLARGTYDLTDGEPADKKMLISSGPFNLAPGDSVQFVVAVLFAWPEWYYNPAVKGQHDKYADHLKSLAANAQWIYNNSYRFPQPPDMPPISIVPDDRRAIIMWDDRSEHSVELSVAFPGVTNPKDFEGYRLWKSPSGSEGSFTLLAEWDVVDFDDLGRPIGANTGLAHSFVDKNLTNGKTYFYALSAYDRGEYAAGHYGEAEFVVVPPLETGKIFGVNLKAESPAVPPSNFTSPQFRQFSQVEGPAGEVSFQVSPQFIIRDSVRSGTFRLYFDNPPNVRTDLPESVPGPDIVVVNASSGDTVSTMTRFPITSPPTTMDSDLFNGTILSCTGPNVLLNRIDTSYFTKPKIRVRIKPETDFPGDYLAFHTSIPRVPPLAFFFQPHTYLVQFLASEQVNVTDMTTGELLPFDLRMLGRDYAIGNFERRVLSVNPVTNDTTWAWANEPAGFKRRRYTNANGYLVYLPGAYVAIEDLDREIQAGDSLFVVLTGKGSPRQGDVFEFSLVGSTVNYKSDLSVIKVVPNPYLVRSAWDLDNDYQRIQFINLPTECTIRIYTVAGDLVSTIHHHDPYAGGFEKQTPGTAYWNLQTMNRQKVATGIYVYYVTSPYGETVGRFAVIR